MKVSSELAMAVSMKKTGATIGAIRSNVFVSTQELTDDLDKCQMITDSIIEVIQTMDLEHYSIYEVQDVVIKILKQKILANTKVEIKPNTIKEELELHAELEKELA